MTRTVALRLALWGWVAATLMATLAPLPSDAYELTSVSVSDKLVHFALFGGLAAMCQLNRWPRAGWGWAVGTAVVTAALIEVVQSPLPYRSGDAWDLAAGAAGAVLLSAGASLLARRVSSKR